jgi:hypothetical protein
MTDVEKKKDEWEEVSTEGDYGDPFAAEGGEDAAGDEAKFEESKHKRDEDNKFSTGGASEMSPEFDDRLTWREGDIQVLRVGWGDVPVDGVVNKKVDEEFSYD